MIKRFRLAMAIVIAAPLAMYRTLVQLARNYSEPVAFVDAFDR